MISRVRTALNTKVAALVVGLGIGALAASGAWNAQYVNDRVTGGPSIAARAAAARDRLAKDVMNPNMIAGQIDGQQVIGHLVQQTGCAVGMVVDAAPPTVSSSVATRGFSSEERYIAITSGATYVSWRVYDVTTTGPALVPGSHLLVVVTLSCP